MVRKSRSLSEHRYEPVVGAHITVKQAQIVGDSLERIAEQHGIISAQHVVSEAQKETSPLHSFFEWNNDKAAHEFRLNTARTLIRSVRVVVLNPQSNPIEIRRAFVHLASQDGYVPTVRAMSVKEYREEIVAQALKELGEWRERYQHLDELARVFEAIDVTLQKKKAAE